MLTKYHDGECVIARVNLTNKIKAGKLGTVCYGPSNQNEPYLVDFDIGDDGIIEVREEDLLSYDG